MMNIEYDAKRIWKLTELKKDIRGSENHLIVGIDVAKETNYAFFGTANGKVILKKFTFRNSSEGFDNFTAKAEKLRKKHDLKRLVFGLEATASYHKPLGEFLIRGGYETVLVSNIAVKRNRELLDGRWDKNDLKDASNVTDLISQGKCLFYDFPTPEISGLQGLISLRKKLKKQEHSLKMRIRNHWVAQYFPELDLYFDSIEDECLSMIKHQLSPGAISSMECQDFITATTTRHKSQKQQSRVIEVWRKAQDSIACKPNPATHFEGSVLVDLLERTRFQKKNTEKEIKAICESIPECRILLSIPGIGPSISATLLAAIGDPHRFQNSRQALKLVGLDLSASRSGKYSQNAVGSISKKGKVDARYALFQAAMIGSSRTPVFRAYFNEKIQDRQHEKGIKTKMRVKLAAKILVIAWTLMRKNELFDPSMIYSELKSARKMKNSDQSAFSSSGDKGEVEETEHLE